MKKLMALIALSTLAACGVDGAPETPAEPGITVGGTVKVGITGGSG
ncbi:argininosuccinate lyase [Vannielia litorea]|nr:argininosuccinate lyase [Vannielia litorea]MBS8227843.1 argininosuccinate lyase [Vannielia litorea]